MEQIKPITFVTTYRGVRNFSKGMYGGRARDIVIAGAESFEATKNIEVIAPQDADARFMKAAGKLVEFLPRVDEMLVYLGLSGANPGYFYIEMFQKKSGIKDIKLVACDCNFGTKADFAYALGLPVIWSECGGMETLEQLVRQRLA